MTRPFVVWVEVPVYDSLSGGCMMYVIACGRISLYADVCQCMLTHVIVCTDVSDGP